MKYEITDYEIDATKTIVVDATGIVEAIYEYLPWEIIEIDLTLIKSKDKAVVVDKVTGFLYDVKLIEDK